MNEQQTKYIPHIGKKLRGHIDLNPLIELGMQVEEKPRYALVRIVKPSRSPAIRVDYDFFKQFEEEYLFKALRDFILELIDAQGRYEGDYTVLRGSEEHRTKAFPENNPAVSIYFSLHDIITEAKREDMVVVVIGNHYLFSMVGDKQYPVYLKVKADSLDGFNLRGQLKKIAVILICVSQYLLSKKDIYPIYIVDLKNERIVTKCKDRSLAFQLEFVKKTEDEDSDKESIKLLEIDNVSVIELTDEVEYCDLAEFVEKLSLV